jgi:hypothetical protein
MPEVLSWKSWVAEPRGIKALNSAFYTTPCGVPVVISEQLLFLQQGCPSFYNHFTQHCLKKVIKHII